MASKEEQGPDPQNKEHGSAGESASKMRSNRRRFLQTGILAAGTLAYAKPRIAVAQGGGGLSPPGPIALPFVTSGAIPGQPFSGTFGTSTYSFTGTVDVSIDADGNVVSENGVFNGTFVSGEDRGLLTLTQLGAMTGAYSGTSVVLPELLGNIQVQEASGESLANSSVSGILNTFENDITLTGVTVPTAGSPTSFAIGIIKEKTINV